MNKEEVILFFDDCTNQTAKILRSILDDQEGYIQAKKDNPKWSELTLELAHFQSLAVRLGSIFKYGIRGVKQIE